MVADLGDPGYALEISSPVPTVGAVSPKQFHFLFILLLNSVTFSKLGTFRGAEGLFVLISYLFGD
jgi:hypothetical protein